MPYFSFTLFNAVFLSSGTVGTLDLLTLCCKGMSCVLQDVFQHPGPLPTRYHQHSPPGTMKKSIQTLPMSPPELKSCPRPPPQVENHNCNEPEPRECICVRHIRARQILIPHPTPLSPPNRVLIIFALQLVIHRISSILGEREKFCHLTSFSDLFQKMRSLRKCKNEAFQLQNIEGCIFINLAWTQQTYPQAEEE